MCIRDSPYTVRPGLDILGRMGTNLITKPIDVIMREVGEAGDHTLKRALGPVHLVMLGIGAIIGAGIFVLTGSAASQYTGPAIILSYVLAGIACVFAWIIGWDLILEYAFGAATVASGWSSTLVAFLQDYGIHLPPQICDTPGKVWVFYQDLSLIHISEPTRLLSIS